MRTLFIFLALVFLLGCQSNTVKNTETNQEDNTVTSNDLEFNQGSLTDLLESKFGRPLSVEKEAEIYTIYKWESFETEYGKKFKNEIDKYLNTLPYKTDTELLKTDGKPSITDIYLWETPRIFVEMKHKFWTIDDKIKSDIAVRINNK